MAKKEYKNVTRSKEAIEKALKALLMEGNELESISVKELSEKAGVNRGTFYNHYQTVDDVLAGIENKFMNSLSQTLRSTNLEDEEGRKAFFSNIGAFLSLYQKDAAALAKYLPMRCLFDIKSKLNKTLATSFPKSVCGIPVDDVFLNKVRFFVSGLVGNYTDILSGKSEGLDIVTATNMAYEIAKLMFPIPQDNQQK